MDAQLIQDPPRRTHVLSLDPEARRHHEAVLTRLGLRHWAAFDPEEVAAAHQGHLDQQRRHAVYWIDDVEIHCPPGVYHATAASSTTFMLRHLTTGMAVGTPPALLEMGVGSGAVLIALARQLGPGRYVGADISADALEAARSNGLRNKVALNLHLSDLFDALPAERFDAIFFNAPLYDREPEDEIERNMLCDPGGRILERFVRDAPHFLKPGGSAFVTVSNIGLIAPLDDPAVSIGLKGAELFDTGVMRALVRIRNAAQ